MILLRKRNGVWHADACINGERKRWSLKTRDRQVAEQLRRQAELELLGGGSLIPKRWPDFREEFLSWIRPSIRPRTMDAYGFTIDKLTAYLQGQGIVLLRDVDPGVITSFMEQRRRELHPSRKRPMTEGGVKFELRNLHRIFGYAVECGYIAKNPVIARNLNSEAGRTMPFTDEEIKRLFADPTVGTRPRLKAILMTFLHTGLRLGDVRDLKKQDVSGEAIIIKTRKRRKMVTIHIHPELREALDDYLYSQNVAQRKSEFLFTGESGAHLRVIENHLKLAFRNAKIESGHVHRFRDTLAVRLLKKGASLYDVAKLLGISIQTAEKHYAPFVRELQKRAAELVSQLDSVASL